MTERILNINDMSIATVVRTPSMSICTTNDEGILEKYFIVYKGNGYRSAEKMCRISFIEPRYIKTALNKTENWILNIEERNLLVKLLESKVGHFKSNGEKMTGWEYAIHQFNSEKGYDDIEIENNILPNKLLDDSVAFNLPMPDYTKLQ